MNSSTSEKSYVKNKLAQLVSLVFVIDYPTVWPGFFTDMMQFARLGRDAADIYLRIMKAIDVEVVDREVSHSAEVGCDKYTLWSISEQWCYGPLVFTDPCSWKTFCKYIASDFFQFKVHRITAGALTDTNTQSVSCQIV